MHARVWPAVALLIALIALGGCVNPFTRFQSAEENDRENDLKTTRVIADVTEKVDSISGGAVQISAIGIVSGLDGTGHTPPGKLRQMLERDLLKMKVENVKKILDSPDFALVMVTAQVPPGHRKGDPLDIEVMVPPESKSTSLRGGYLEVCSLRNYEFSQNLNGNQQTNELLAGHVLGRARGPLLVGLGDPEGQVELRRGRIWGGGEFLTDRPYYLPLKKDDKSAKMANAVAERLNHIFREDTNLQRLRNERLLLLDEATKQINKKFDGTGLAQGDIAQPMGKDMIVLNVPYAYRFNSGRYLLVARFVPLWETPEQRTRYRQRLTRMLLDPQEAIHAALRLEALGQDSVPVLKTALSSNHPLVRFAAAESLSYLGSTTGAETLAKLAEEHQKLRFWSLIALASLDEATCRNRLADLFDRPDPELRVGAFVALRMLDHTNGLRRDERLGGERLPGGYWLHHVARQSAPMVHVSLAKSPEIILFGDKISLVTPVKLLAGPEFTVTAENGNGPCTVSRFDARHGTERKQCSLQLDEVIRTMAELGAQYPDVVDFLSKASERKCLNCPLRVNTAPKAVTLQELADGGRDANFLRDEE